MRILHLNTFDIKGGAARAAYRIHKALNENCQDSKMLVVKKKSYDPDIKKFSIFLHKRRRIIEEKIFSLQKSSNPSFHSLNLIPSTIYREINQSSSDIVHFHWLGLQLISIEEIKKITKPIVWTLHDMWAFCGAEHCIDLNSSERYREGYCSTNRPLADKGIFDIDKWVWKRKQKSWNNVKFHFVAPSKWLADCVQKSKLFSGEQATVIPNCLDTQVFQPKNKEICRGVFGLDLKKKIVLFGADGGGKNPLKGFHLLQESLKILSSSKLSDEIQCVVFGGHKHREQKDMYGISTNHIGRIADDEQLASLYNAADIFITPSMIDNLPNTVMEAMSCGVPCIGFDIGGIPDLIDHKENGFLVPPYSSLELADGIQWLLSDMNRLMNFGKAARSKVLENYTPDIIAKQYIAFYRQVLLEHGNKSS